MKRLALAVSALLVLAALLFLAVTCRRPAEPAASVAEPGPDAADLFDAWKQARAALRQSPDHLPAQAEARVAAKDAAALFAFVRDRIAVYPPGTDGFDNAVRARRWGSRATLRGGAGTPREKVDLLAELLQRAGFEVRLLAGKADPALVDGRKLLLREHTLQFAPAFGPAQVERWRQLLRPPARQRHRIDADGSQARALAAQLAPLLPEAAAGARPFDFGIGEIPLLEVKIDGQWVVANPIGAALQLGQSGVVGSPRIEHGSAQPTPEIRVTLEAARSDAPYRRFPLVSRSYRTEDVAGRRIHVGFAPPIPAMQLAWMDPARIDAFVPVIGVVGDGLAGEEAMRLAAAGEVITRGGDMLSRKDGAVAINGEVLGEADPGAVARVASLQARVQANAFPQVRVAVSARDAAGHVVDRLPASAFALAEDGAQRGFTLLRNSARPPRVMLLFDVSSSMPAAFRGEASVALGERLVDAIYAQWPQAQFQLATIAYGASFSAPGWAGDAASARARLQHLRTPLSASEIWTALHKVQQADPGVVILVSDGDATDAPDDKVREQLARGAPVFSLAVGQAHEDFFAEVSRLSGGRHLAVDDAGQAIGAILDELARRQGESYELVYEAPIEGAAQRQVTLSLPANGSAGAGDGRYAVPGQAALPQALSGLYLTVSMGGRSHTVTLAGHRLRWEVPGVGVTAAELEDVRGALLGRVLLAVEGAAPTLSLVLDEWIGDKLSLEPLWRAYEANDEAAMLEAWAAGFQVTPGALALATTPLPDASGRDGLTFETQPRISAVWQKLVPGGRYTQQLSYFPLHQWRTAAADPARAWQRTLQATAGLAVVEAGLLQGDSTLSALRDQALQALLPIQARMQAGLDPADSAAWAAMSEGFDGQHWRLLAPKRPLAAWAVHQPSGSLLGLLPDGSGGSAEEVCSTYKQASRTLALASVLGHVSGADLGPWGALAQWEIDQLTVAILVIGHDAELEPGMIRGPVGDLACDALSGALGDAIPAYGHYSAAGDAGAVIGIDAGLPSICPDVPQPCG